MQLFRRLDNRGDTIVEVLICIAVISSVLGGAYVVINRTTQNSQQSREHSQALKVAESQLEQLRGMEDLSTVGNKQFCFDKDNKIQTASDAGIDDTFPSGTYTNACKLDDGSATGRYTVAINRDSNKDTYKVNVQWDGPTGSKDFVGLAYKLYQNVGDVNSFIASETKPSITVTVSKVSQRTGNLTPDCSDTNLVNKSGITVGVTSFASQTTNQYSQATFSDVIPGNSYQVRVTVPAGYEACSSNTTNVIAGSLSTALSFKIRPICTESIVPNSGHWVKGAYRGQYWYGRMANGIYTDTAMYRLGTIWVEWTGASDAAGNYLFKVWNTTYEYDKAWTCPS